MTLRKSRLNLATQALIGIPTMMLGAQAIADDDDAIVLDTLTVEERTLDTNPYAQKGAPYKARISGDARHTKELAETPQTITVLTQTQIKESGKSDIKDIVAAQPGISLGTGENGNAFGDRYVIRGHEARSDVFVDGLRDPGMTTRESFATEQIEITKGPSSTFAGRGSSGGAVNSITKQASSEYDFNKVEAAIGTDSHRRITLDSNLPLSDDLAVRANLLHSYEEVPDRAPADRERNGMALSAAYQATDDIKLIGDYYHLNAFDHADLGSFIDRDTGKVYEDIPSYVQEEDFLKSRVDTVTLRAEWQISDTMLLTNAMRHGTTNNGYYVTGAGSSEAYIADSTDTVTDATETYSSIGLSSHQGWQEVEYFANQLNLHINTQLGGMNHAFVIGGEYSKHDVLNGTYTGTANGATNCITSGRGGVSNSYCLLDENGNEVANINNLLQRDITKGSWDSNYQISTVSLYLMDTVDVTDEFSVFAGVRADSYEYRNDVMGRGSDVPTTYEYDDTLWNGHIGVVYDLSHEGNVYATYSTAANINGGESDVGGSCGYGGICSSAENVDKAKPEDVENIELGTKWNLMNQKLLATAAVFRITKDNVMEGTDYDTDGTYNTGKNRVQGLEVSLVGNLTERLSTQFGYTLMKSEILETAATNRDGTPVATGGRLANFADRAGFLQLRYQMTDKLSVGGAATHSSEVYVGQPDSTASEDIRVPTYTVFDAFASYQVNNQLGTRLNIGNYTNKDYYQTAYRSGSFAYKGDALNAQLTVAYEF